MRAHWPHDGARAALRAALVASCPQVVVEDVRAGLRARFGALRCLVLVGPGIYRWLLGLQQSPVYRGPRAAARCGRDVVAALQRASATARVPTATEV